MQSITHSRLNTSEEHNAILNQPIQGSLQPVYLVRVAPRHSNHRDHRLQARYTEHLPALQGHLHLRKLVLQTARHPNRERLVNVHGWWKWEENVSRVVSWVRVNSTVGSYSGIIGAVQNHVLINPNPVQRVTAHSSERGPGGGGGYSNLDLVVLCRWEIWSTTHTNTNFQGKRDPCMNQIT